MFYILSIYLIIHSINFSHANKNCHLLLIVSLFNIKICNIDAKVLLILRPISLQLLLPMINKVKILERYLTQYLSCGDIGLWPVTTYVQEYKHQYRAELCQADAGLYQTEAELCYLGISKTTTIEVHIIYKIVFW